MEAQIDTSIKPKPQITWMKDGKKFESNEHVKLKEEADGTLKLFIMRSESTDKMRLTIKAENKFGSAGKGGGCRVGVRCPG